MAVGATGGVDGADAVEFKVIVGELAVGAHEEFNAGVLVDGGVVGIVDGAQIVAANHEVNVDVVA